MAEITGSPEYMAKTYVDYQKKYRENIRESDKTIIELIQKNISFPEGKSLLDIGCHNGNLLFHIKNTIPSFSLYGIDLFPDVIEVCRNDPDLKGIKFDTMNILDLHCDPVDVIVVSAVLFRFSDTEHLKIWQSFHDRLKAGGLVFSFDFYNPFCQTLRIIEETETHPEGLVLNFRPQQDVATMLAKIGFLEYQFNMFQIPIDLDLQGPTDPLYTYTKRLANNERLQFRGALYQPWCHLVAKK